MRVDGTGIVRYGYGRGKAEHITYATPRGTYSIPASTYSHTLPHMFISETQVDFE